MEQKIEVLLCWMDAKPLRTGSRYLLQLNTRTVKSIVKEIQYKLDVNSLEKIYDTEQVGLNDVVKVTIKTASPLVFDSYQDLRNGGGAILIDETSNVTVGAALIQ